jgi:hypothetical protein
LGKYVGPEHIWVEKTNDVWFKFHLFHKSPLGIVSVYKIGNTKQDSGKIIAITGISVDKPTTHLTMLSLRQGMTFAQMAASAGMPNWTSGSGLVRLDYVTADGYRYSIFAGNASPSDSGPDYDSHAQVVSYWSIIDPNGNYLSEEDVVAFQWTVRLVYLGVAAILSVALVLLIKIPNNIRKRKEISEAK